MPVRNVEGVDMLGGFTRAALLLLEGELESVIELIVVCIREVSSAIEPAPPAFSGEVRWGRLARSSRASRIRDPPI